MTLWIANLWLCINLFFGFVVIWVFLGFYDLSCWGFALFDFDLGVLWQIGGCLCPFCFGFLCFGRYGFTWLLLVCFCFWGNVLFVGLFVFFEVLDEYCLLCIFYLLCLWGGFNVYCGLLFVYLCYLNRICVYCFWIRFTDVMGPFLFFRERVCFLWSFCWCLGFVCGCLQICVFVIVWFEFWLEFVFAICITALLVVFIVGLLCLLLGCLN